MTAETTVHAGAKVNLYLHVTGRRNDNYHLLHSLAVFPRGVSDEIHLQKSDRYTLGIRGPFAGLLADAPPDGNLAMKAARAFFTLSNRDFGVDITLHKNLPAGAGLGGGSSDAAAVFAALEQMYGDSFPQDARRAALLTLGADVPVCDFARPCYIEGIGERLSPAPALPPCHLVLAWPNRPVSTVDVFRSLSADDWHPVPAAPSSFQDLRKFVAFLKATRNSLEPAAMALCPPIAQALALMGAQDRCLIARMSGSGSCVFGLFEQEKSAARAAMAIRAAHPDWWVSEGRL